MTNFAHVTLEMKLIVAGWTIVGCPIRNNEICLTRKASFEKTDISHLDSQCTSHCFLEETTYAILFRDMASINYKNLIKIVMDVFEKVAILCFGAELKVSYFWC
jgi:hypothetical protein